MMRWERLTHVVVTTGRWPVKKVRSELLSGMMDSMGSMMERR